MDLAIALLLAIAIDQLVGDPPTAFHPVGWIGRLIALLESRAPSKSPAAQLLYGTFMVVLVLALTAGLCYALLNAAASWNRWAYVLCAALVLKSTFALRELCRAAGRVKSCLLGDDLSGARWELRALVSRDTTKLSPPQLAAAAVESVAENSVDSVIAPLFFFVLFAPAGVFAPVAALSYRVVNTFDSMVGYRGRYEYLGKAAARLDDLLNWLPSRLGAFLLIAAASLLALGRNGSQAAIVSVDDVGGKPLLLDARNAWRVLRLYHDRTESPNAGLTMSAAAGALHVTLEKVGHYRLGDGGLPGPATIDGVCRLAVTSILFFAVLCSIILLVVS